MFFKIYSSQGDEEGLDVSVIDLFKFLRGITRPAETFYEESMDLSVYDRATGTPSIEDKST